jgi:hypothetical protein
LLTHPEISSHRPYVLSGDMRKIRNGQQPAVKRPGFVHYVYKSANCTVPCAHRVMVCFMYILITVNAILLIAIYYCAMLCICTLVVRLRCVFLRSDESHGRRSA